jgi:hypothetical protein
MDDVIQQGSVTTGEDDGGREQYGLAAASNTDYGGRQQ